MARVFSHGQRGQASLEFILVLIFMLVMVTGVVVPLGQRMQAALEDVSLVGSVASAQVHVENDLNALLASPSSSVLPTEIFIPKGASVQCDPNTQRIVFTFSLHRSVFRLDGSVPSPACVENGSGAQYPMTCTKVLGMPSNASLTCQGNTLLPYTVQTGTQGFVQRFTLSSTYTQSPTSHFVVDLSIG